jgi:hypothetical protein
VCTKNDGNSTDNERERYEPKYGINCDGERILFLLRLCRLPALGCLKIQENVERENVVANKFPKFTPIVRFRRPMLRVELANLIVRLIFNWWIGKLTGIAAVYSDFSLVQENTSFLILSLFPT